MNHTGIDLGPISPQLPDQNGPLFLDPNGPQQQQRPGNIPRQRFEDLLRNNRLGIVDNPLFYRNPEDILRDVEEFYEDHRLADVVDVGLLKRGALLARDRDEFMEDNILSSVERRALLREENPKFWQQTRELQAVLLTCCIGAIVQGWSQANITGADLFWPTELGLDVDAQGSPQGKDIWIFGLVNSSTFFAASLVGGWLSDPLNEHFFGRRGALFVAGIFSLGASIGSAYTQSWRALFICRCLQGIGMGAKAAVVPIFESEVSPARIRGRLLVSWQTFTAFGIFLGSSSNLIFHTNWRWQIGSAFIPTIPLLCLVFICSESPHWLLKGNRYGEAYAVLQRLRETPLQAARDLYNLHAQIQVETILFSRNQNVSVQLDNWDRHANRLFQEEFNRTNFFGRLIQLFTVERNRRASLAACVVMASQQLSGINIFAFLSNSFLSDGANFSVIRSLWLSFGFAAANTVFSPVAYFFIDSKGRRFLLLLSLMLMMPLLIAMGFSLKIYENIPDHPTRVGVVELFIILYTAAYSPGAGVVPFLYSSEVFPLINREVGMSLSCSVNFFLAGLLALSVPQLTSELGSTTVLGLFAGLDSLAIILVWLLVPGTREVTTLEEMNYIFGVPMLRHIQYQLMEVLPWLAKKYIPWWTTKYLPWAVKYYLSCGRSQADIDPGRDLAPLVPLYTWNSVRRIAQQQEINPDALHLD